MKQSCLQNPLTKQDQGFASEIEVTAAWAATGSHVRASLS